MRPTVKAAARGRRVQVVLSCMVCGARNYRTQRARGGRAQPLRIKKYCRTCNAHTAHIEAK